jgi:hypothetical protein
MVLREAMAGRGVLSSTPLQIKGAKALCGWILKWANTLSKVFV